jgi:hypothetical protein
MSDFNITKDKLEESKQFFLNNTIDVLTNISIEINTEQPNFTGVLLALEMHGLDIIEVEDLLETIFVIYYAQTRLHKRSIPEITIEEVFKNVSWFEQFIGYYNDEKNDKSSDLSEIRFLRDDIVLDYAFETLESLFGEAQNIPKEVVYGYFALLKGIEMGAEKSTAH